MKIPPYNPLETGKCIRHFVYLYISILYQGKLLIEKAIDVQMYQFVSMLQLYHNGVIHRLLIQRFVSMKSTVVLWITLTWKQHFWQSRQALAIVPAVNIRE